MNIIQRFWLYSSLYNSRPFLLPKTETRDPLVFTYQRWDYKSTPQCSVWGMVFVLLLLLFLFNTIPGVKLRSLYNKNFSNWAICDCPFDHTCPSDHQVVSHRFDPLTLVISLSHIANHFYVFLGEMVIQFLCSFKDSVAIYGWVRKVPCMLWTLETFQSYFLY